MHLNDKILQEQPKQNVFYILKKNPKHFATFVSSCLAVFLRTMHNLSAAMALAVHEDTKRLTPSRRLEHKKQLFNIIF